MRFSGLLPSSVHRFRYSLVMIGSLVVGGVLSIGHQPSLAQDVLAPAPVESGSQQTRSTTPLDRQRNGAPVIPKAAAPPAVADAAVSTLKPGDQDGLVAGYVARLLPKRHFSGRPVDSQVSGRAVEIFLKTLDPMKLYFYQSDIEEFAPYRTTIHDLVLQRDLSPAYKIFARYLQRVNERVAVAQELLKQDFDFEAADSIVIDPKNTSYARNADEAYDRWRRQIKYNLLDLKHDDKTLEEAREQLERRYARYARRWSQIDSDELLELYLSAITMAYDPHTTYMSPSTLNDFNIQMQLNLDGIGAALREKDGYTVVSDVIPGGAADKDGRLKADDHIVSVGQNERDEMVDIVEMPLKQVVNKIRGKAGTTVRLGVKKGGVGEVEIYQLTRAKVQLEDSAARGKVIEHQPPGGGDKMKIGYINLPSFYMDMQGARNNVDNFRSSTRDVRRILDDFRRQGVQAVVLDLSRNGGGSLTEAISLTGLFTDRGPVVRTKNGVGDVHDLANDEVGVAWDGPLVVMTSKFSASASEILAGAIKDYRRGIVVGDPTTHGKGTVQSLLDLGEEVFRNRRFNLGALKVTVQQYYLPDGDSTQLDGVAADVILPSITSVMDISESDLDYALPHDRVPPVRHRTYNMVPPNVLATIRQNSIDRVQQDSEFIELLRRKETYVRQKEEKTLSLVEADFVARRKLLDAQKEEEKQELELTETSSEKVFVDNYYNREVLSITHDYARGLREQNLASIAR